MKLAPSRARFSVCRIESSNAGSPVSFLRSAMTTETGSGVLVGRREPFRAVERPDKKQHHQRGDPRQRRPRQPPDDRQRLAVLVEPVQRRLQLHRRLKSLVRVRLETAADDGVDRLRNFGVDAARCRRRLLHPRVQLGDRALRPGRAAAANQHVVKDQTEGVDVSPLIDRQSLRLLGRHVLDRADDGAGHGAADEQGSRRRRLMPPAAAAPGRIGRRASDAEIHDRRLVIGADHDVGGLQIAVDDARVVRRHQAGGDAASDVERTLHRKLLVSLENRREVRAVDVRHRDVLDAVDLAEIVNPDDVAMRHRAGEQQLALEATLDFARRSGSAVNSGRMTFTATDTPSSASHAW